MQWQDKVVLVLVGVMLNLFIVWRYRRVIEWSQTFTLVVVPIFCLIPYLVFGVTAICWAGWQIGKRIATFNEEE